MSSSHNTIKILVVDDEKLIRLTISAKLKVAGYTPVAVGSVDEAVSLLKSGTDDFCAVISDIMMGDMDGFVFRDIVRGIVPTMPFFFLTALDPEEGSGFLRRIVEDPISYYLPKSVATDVLIKRVQRVVASRHVAMFVERKMEEDRQSLELAAQVQRSLLPIRAKATDLGFYTTFWCPSDIVSGDLYEAVPYGEAAGLYVLGDIQGHGTSAALAMTAVQSFLKHFSDRRGNPALSPCGIANQLQKFFRTSLADISYMTALICVHDVSRHEVTWISCGAGDLYVVGNGQSINANPEKRGNLPIGLVGDTVYSHADEVTTPLPPGFVAAAVTDGVLDISRDTDGNEQLTQERFQRLLTELAADAITNAACIAIPHKVAAAFASYGYDNFHDDVTMLLFGARNQIPGIFDDVIPLTPEDVDAVAQKVAAWCDGHFLPGDLSARIQIVIAEKLMNIYDHGFDERDRQREAVGLRAKIVRDHVHLTVWDYGTPDPSIEVAAGDSSTAFELVNREMKGCGRGRLMLRELCSGVERNRYRELNETIYHIPIHL
ncbi:MAG: SpoIIE family protein phosphatase [Kiritimatiellae bacterium]|nr:SpoIIE family protein phosphatase [Kiritimatiellia bacterium]